jgi:hypothetical protein
MAKKTAARSGTTGLMTHDPQLKTFFHGLETDGLVIKKKKGARIKNVKRLLVKHARVAFNLGPMKKSRTAPMSERAGAKAKATEAEPVSWLVGEGIPTPSKGELPWATAADVAALVNREHMLPAEDFAKQLGVSRETVNEWRKAGKAIGVRGAKRGFRFPAWQVSGRGQIFPAIERILEELDQDHFAAWRFLEERVPEVGDIGFQALAAGKEEALLKALLGRSYGSFS